MKKNIEGMELLKKILNEKTMIEKEARGLNINISKDDYIKGIYTGIAIVETIILESMGLEFKDVNTRKVNEICVENIRKQFENDLCDTNPFNDNRFGG